MTDKPTVHIDSSTIREDILDYQVQNCPKCGTELQESFGLGGGGFGPYGYCEPCGRIIWKCSVEE